MWSRTRMQNRSTWFAGGADLAIESATQEVVQVVEHVLCVILGVRHVVGLGRLHRVARVALGDRQAFRRLYEATAPSLLGVALRLLRDRGRGEDVIQDCLLYTSPSPRDS